MPSSVLKDASCLQRPQILVQDTTTCHRRSRISNSLQCNHCFASGVYRHPRHPPVRWQPDRLRPYEGHRRRCPQYVLLDSLHVHDALGIPEGCPPRLPRRRYCILGEAIRRQRREDLPILPVGCVLPFPSGLFLLFCIFKGRERFPTKRYIPTAWFLSHFL